MPKPRILLITGITLVVIALLIMGILYLTADANSQTTFWSNTWLNIAVEFMGIGFGLGIPLIILGFNAKKKFEDTATQIAELVAQLRAEGKISKEAARKSMVCAVNIIPKEHISRESNNQYRLCPKKDSCDVCALEVDLKTNDKCEHCGLEKHVWNIKNKPLIPATYSTPQSPK